MDMLTRTSEWIFNPMCYTGFAVTRLDWINPLNHWVVFTVVMIEGFREALN